MPTLKHFEAVAEEMDKGHVQHGLWTKAFAESGGSKDATQALYIQWRAAQIEADDLEARSRSGDLVTTSGVSVDEQDPQETVPIYFPASLTKLIVLSICTFSLYQIYWFGENWRLENNRTNEGLRPAWRAIFGLFFCHALLSRIKRYARQAGVPATYPPALLTLAWILLTLSYRLPDPYSLVGIFSFLPLLPVQGTIRRINRQETPQADRNTRFSGRNWVAVVIGGIIYVLAVLGTLIPQ